MTKPYFILAPHCEAAPGELAAGFYWAYLQDTLVVDLVEDGAVDLIGLQRRPVEDWQSELGFDWLLNSDRCFREMSFKKQLRNWFILFHPSNRDLYLS